MISDIIERLATHFHLCSDQLQHRYNNRPPFNISDEYDVQDLFHALLRLFFTDVRKEEVAPSFAGAGSRIDFLLPVERIGIEVKMTRPGLAQKELGKQLMEDITLYRTHATCETLVVFVHDPGKHVRNPTGIKTDLETLDNAGMAVRVVINQG